MPPLRLALILVGAKRPAEVGVFYRGFADGGAKVAEELAGSQLSALSSSAGVAQAQHCNP